MRQGVKNHPGDRASDSDRILIHRVEFQTANIGYEGRFAFVALARLDRRIWVSSYFGGLLE